MVQKYWTFPARNAQLHRSWGNCSPDLPLVDQIAICLPTRSVKLIQSIDEQAETVFATWLDEAKQTIESGLDIFVTQFAIIYIWGFEIDQY
jgi:hypothetical protein